MVLTKIFHHVLSVYMANCQTVSFEGCTTLTFIILKLTFGLVLQLTVKNLWTILMCWGKVEQTLIIKENSLSFGVLSSIDYKINDNKVT